MKRLAALTVDSTWPTCTCQREEEEKGEDKRIRGRGKNKEGQGKGKLRDGKRRVGGKEEEGK